jgi:2-phosphoglycolate phosphatase
MSQQRYKAVFFDLDGTLLDSAPDLAYSLNQTLLQHGRAPMTLEQIRPHASHGTQALLQLGFSMDPDAEGFEALRQLMLDTYRANLSRDSCLFEGMEALLGALEDRAIPWGIVTNKPAFLTDPLSADFGFDQRCACIVSGDTLPRCKPHPDPILHACEVAGIAPQQAVYVGDAERDIEAGRRAGTRTLAARWGYLRDTDRIEHWGADAVIDTPLEILDWLH